MTQSFFKLSFLSGVSAVALTATAASASTLSLTYHGASSGADAKNVTIQAAPVTYPGSGDWPNTVGAWGFQMQDSTGGLGSFLAWCLDLGSFLSSSAVNAKPYSITSTPFDNSYGLSGAAQDRVQTLFDANFDALDTADGNSAAGFQLALWDAVYDGDGDMTSGAFQATASTAILDLASDYFGAADAYGGTKQYNVSYLQSDDSNGGKYQNLVTVAPVPIPAAGVLMLLALGGLGAASRRAKQG